VIFVHGNTADHGDWYPVRDDFEAAGWSEQELWALSYNGLGVNVSSTEARDHPQAEDERAAMGHDGLSRATSNEVNVPDLVDVIQAVRDYTGSQRFSLVSHSLGVTIARRAMHLHPDLAADVVAFVGIAGGNHGTSLCPPGSERVVVGCDEIAMGTTWLDELNGPDGERETYGDTAWITIRSDDVAEEPTPAAPTDTPSPHPVDVTGEGGHDTGDGADRAGSGDPADGGPPEPESAARSCRPPAPHPLVAGCRRSAS
jgi:pimeloyl-ACP methyl ester carboxylesterase